MNADKADSKDKTTNKQNHSCFGFISVFSIFGDPHPPALQLGCISEVRGALHAMNMGIQNQNFLMYFEKNLY